MTSHPLVVDLDGTLIRTDVLHESTIKFFKKNPLGMFYLPFWLFKSKALLKHNVASHIDLDPAILPYNHELLNWLKEQKNGGRQLILCTASDQSVATLIANYLGFFDQVISSDGIINLAGGKKAEVLEKEFGANGFDYVGNAKVDLKVWKRARRAIVVSDSKSLIQKAKDVCEVDQIFPTKPLTLKVGGGILRMHQWLKNVLLFVPLLAAHQLSSLNNWVLLFFSFLSFCFCASAIYITNDLFDLDSDRLHPSKRNRPFASGKVPAWVGIVTAPISLLFSLCLGYYVGPYFFFWLVAYFILACAYSWTLKRLVLIDCLTLTMLYTLRIVAGGAVVSIELSFWILAFSVFVFLSLSFLKRYAELGILCLHQREKAHGRDYYGTDAPLIQTLGIASGYAAVVVLSLYLNSDKVRMLYKMPGLLWAAVPILLFWISWMWLQAHRGLMQEDPFLFAIKNKISLFAGVLFTSTLVISAIGLS